MKEKLKKQVISKLNEDLNSLKKAAAETRSVSSDDENKQEGKYDTRSIEASYLAEAQADQATQIEESIFKLQNLTLPEEPDTVILGSIAILTDTEDHDLQFFLLPAGGGISLEYENQPLMVITPESPIGEKIIAKALLDNIEETPIGPVFISEIY